MNSDKYTLILRDSDMTKVSINITVDEEVIFKFKRLCRDMDIKVSTKINTLMKEWIVRNGEKRE